MNDAAYDVQNKELELPSSAEEWRLRKQPRIMVYWALELAVREATFPPTIDVYEGPDGTRRCELGDGKELARKWVMDSFRAFCSDHNVTPRNPYSPLAKDFSGEGWQSTFTISANEFEQWLAIYLEASSQDQPTAEPKGKPESAPPDPGLPTSELAMAFGRHNVGGWGITDWQNNLEDPPGWLKRHRLLRGKRGNNSYQARWDPLAIARALIDGPCGKRPKTCTKSLDPSFADEELEPWREPWKNFKALKVQQDSFGM